MRIKAFFGAAFALSSFFLSLPAVADEFTRKSFVLPKGSFELTGDPARPAMAGFALSENSVAKPIWLAPHFYWGVSDDLSIGISHQRGLCFNSAAGRGGGECGKAYNDAGFDLLLWLTGSEKFELDLHAGVPIQSFDPFMIGIQAGVLGRVNIGAVTAFVFDPSVYIGFTERPRGNREILYLPFWFYFQATDAIVPFVGSGMAGPLDGYFDFFQVPLEAGMLFAVNKDIDLGFALRFENLMGKGGSADWRNLYFLGRFRF